MSKIPKIKVKNAVLYTIVHTVMIMLKLSGSVDWSWWWIFSPAWLLFVFMFIELTWMRYVTRRHEAIVKLSAAITETKMPPPNFLNDLVYRMNNNLDVVRESVNNIHSKHNNMELEALKIKIRLSCFEIEDALKHFVRTEVTAGNNCETPNKKCFMNYCDENGCQDRIRTEAGPIHPQNT
jgi:hypothetical protein